MTVLERIIRLTGFQPTNYPFMSFDGDSVSRYYSAMSGAQTPAATLRALVRTYPSALVAYSGGVDSALLAVVVRQARGRGLAVVCDGTNADDLREHRPGYAAGQAAGVRSPLVETGLTKADVRQAARELGLPVWDAPAAPCLSSRVAYSIPITAQRLAQVERAETYLRELGVTGDLRVRHHGDRGGARIEVEPRWVPWVVERLAAVRAHLVSLGFAAVEVDPRRYRAWGSPFAG